MEDEEKKNNKNSDSGHIQFTPSSDEEDENVDRRFGGLAVVYGDAPAPPPPPPPQESSMTWDLMNFFSPYDMSLHYPESYNLLRERAGMVAEGKKMENKEEVVQVEKSEKSLKVTEVVVEEKSQRNDVKEKEKKKKEEISVDVESRAKLKSAVDVLEETKVLFEKASESGIGVLKLLKAEADQNYVFQLDSGEKANLPSTLRKLSIWEHKLYTEVKAEEEMRVRHEDLQRRLKKQDEKGSEAQKVDATQKAMMSLAPKMKIAFDMVNRISIVISKLRDEELWPCLKELMHE